MMRARIPSHFRHELPIRYWKCRGNCPQIRARFNSQYTHLRDELRNRRLPIIYDTIGPGPDELLNITLQDFLPLKPISQAWNPRNTISKEGNVPPGHHLIYFPPPTRLSQLLPDGTDPDQSPGEPFVRRMWAGGSINFRPHLDSTLSKSDRPAACLERIKEVKIKGDPGEEKIFVTIERRISRLAGLDGFEREVVEGRNEIETRNLLEDDANCAVVEQRELVFMRERRPEVPAPTEPKTEKTVTRPGEPVFAHVLTPTPALLFRFSALTFNAHRIHLDKQYCCDIESHRNLLVHGPLSLVLMLDTLRAYLAGQERAEGGKAREVEGIEYRNVAPLYAEEVMTVCGRIKGRGRWDVWIEGRDGGLAVKGKVWTTY